MMLYQFNLNWPLDIKHTKHTLTYVFGCLLILDFDIYNNDSTYSVWEFIQSLASI